MTFTEMRIIDNNDLKFKSLDQVKVKIKIAERRKPIRLLS